MNFFRTFPEKHHQNISRSANTVVSMMSAQNIFWACLSFHDMNRRLSARVVDNREASRMSWYSIRGAMSAKLDSIGFQFRRFRWADLSRWHLSRSSNIPACRLQIEPSNNVRRSMRNDQCPKTHRPGMIEKLIAESPITQQASIFSLLLLSIKREHPAPKR